MTADEMFAKGLAEYDAGNYDTSRKLFRKSYDLEPNPKKLYALGQAERYSGNCRTAVEVYDEALSGDLSDGAKKIVNEARSDCQLVLDEAAKISSEEVARRLEEARAQRQPARIIVIDRAAGRAWYKDPVAGIITATGIVALGVGGTFFWLGDKQAKKALDADTFDEFQEHYDNQERLRNIGLISAIAGGALVVGGTTWYLLRAIKANKTRRTEQSVEVTSYATRTGGGFVISGRF
jgi:tetratricopeptide (TPR) repeat protein